MRDIGDCRAIVTATLLLGAGYVAYSSGALEWYIIGLCGGGLASLLRHLS